MSRYYSVEGNPITIDQLTSARADGDWERAARKTKVNDDTDVSTVWLGLDHSFSAGGPPIIFESMIFGGNLDQEQHRYSTMDEAHADHERLVEKVRTEAAEFADLAADPKVRDCVALIQEVLRRHQQTFDLGDYGTSDLYGALVKVVEK